MRVIALFPITTIVITVVRANRAFIWSLRILLFIRLWRAVYRCRTFVSTFIIFVYAILEILMVSGTFTTSLRNKVVPLGVTLLPFEFHFLSEKVPLQSLFLLELLP